MPDLPVCYSGDVGQVSVAHTSGPCTVSCLGCSRMDVDQEIAYRGRHGDTYIVSVGYNVVSVHWLHLHIIDRCSYSAHRVHLIQHHYYSKGIRTGTVQTRQTDRQTDKREKFATESQVQSSPSETPTNQQPDPVLDTQGEWK